MGEDLTLDLTVTSCVLIEHRLFLGSSFGREVPGVDCGSPPAALTVRLGEQPRFALGLRPLRCRPRRDANT